TGIGSGTGGYYLFFAWPLVGIGFAGIWSLGTGRWRRLVLTCAVTAAVLFEAGGLWFSAQVYAGFIEKVGTTKIGEGGMAFSLENLLELHQRLGYLGFPTLALACYAGSLGLRVFVFRRLMQHDNADAHCDSESTGRQRMLRINRDPREHAAA
ncbi:MAG: hypothetical protein IH899_11040, partial [Planctomycetes bacterium]|nr:hypothetical protein [Planctomycetota bacterium]